MIGLFGKQFGELGKVGNADCLCNLLDAEAGSQKQSLGAFDPFGLDVLAGPHAYNPPENARKMVSADAHQFSQVAHEDALLQMIVDIIEGEIEPFILIAGFRLQKLRFPPRNVRRAAKGYRCSRSR